MTPLSSSKQMVCLLVLLCGTATAQDHLWDHVTPRLFPLERPAANLSAAQKNVLGRKIVQVAQRDPYNCNGQEITDLLSGLTYEQLPLKSGAKTVMAISGMGCARGGQGANGAMWLFDVSGQHPVYLGEIDGWGPGVLRASSTGYRDVVTKWHSGISEGGLTYYRFDGKEYRPIEDAVTFIDAQGKWKITPSKSRIFSH